MQVCRLTRGWNVDKETRYQYQKRIKELELENSAIRGLLYRYKEVCSAIYTTTLDLMQQDKEVSQAWILRQFRRVWE